MIRCTGKLSYGRNWVILYCSRDLVRLYASMIPKAWGKVQPPKHGAHISVVRDDEVRSSRSRFRDGETIEFTYDPAMLWSEKYVWMDVESKELVEVRRKMNLSDEPKYGFHLTVGTWMDWQEDVDLPWRKMGT
jgi:hypothetical protein